MQPGKRYERGIIIGRWRRGRQMPSGDDPQAALEEIARMFMSAGRKTTLQLNPPIKRLNPPPLPQQGEIIMERQYPIIARAMQGIGKLIVDDRRHVVIYGDWIYIPPGVEHRWQEIPIPDKSFVVVYATFE